MGITAAGEKTDATGNVGKVSDYPSCEQRFNSALQRTVIIFINSF